MSYSKKPGVLFYPGLGSYRRAPIILRGRESDCIPIEYTGYEKDGLFLYFIFAEWCNRIKIGVSYNVEKRLSELNGSCPYPLRLLGIIKMGAPYDLERVLHRKFSEFRRHREWFEGAQPILDFISENCAELKEVK